MKSILLAKKQGGSSNPLTLTANWRIALLQ
jgi:hypothetical protein